MLSPGFDRYVTDPTRRTQSFCVEQVKLLHLLVMGLAQGRDVAPAVRHPQFSKLAKKVIAMREKSEAARRVVDAEAGGSDD